MQFEFQLQHFAFVMKVVFQIFDLLFQLAFFTFRTDFVNPEHLPEQFAAAVQHFGQ